ncbi:MAG: methionyl-tRNA formyltransferase [Pseudomonadota bacterium]
MRRASRIGFAGSPDFAATILEGLIATDFAPVLVLSQPPRPAGRGRKLRPSAVAELATANGIPVQTPRTLKTAAAQEALAAFELDLLIVAAYGLILPQAVLDLPQLGCLNVHASLLPRWRGAAPIERAIMAGDTETGVALMQMEAGLDTGPVYQSTRIAITPTTTGHELEAALAAAGTALLLELLPSLLAEPQPPVPVPQAEQGVTYAHKLTAADSEIDWRRSATEIDRQVRALTGRQPALARLGKLRLKLLSVTVVEDAAIAAAPGTILGLEKRGLRVATGAGALLLNRVQLNRGKGTPLDGVALRNGYSDLFPNGSRFDEPTAADSA